MTLIILLIAFATLGVIGSLIIRNYPAAVYATCWLMTELQRYELLKKLGELQ
jgi:hypothetical protein